MIRTLVFGAGRMARRVLSKLGDSGDFERLGVVARKRPEDLSGLNWFASLDDAQGFETDLLIDFTLPGGTGAAAQWCERQGVALLSGTTGLSDEDIGAMQKAASKVAVLWAPNMSYGVALMTSFVRQAAGLLDPACDITVTDIHHKHKIDAPSGTALALAKAVLEGRGESPVDFGAAATVAIGEGGSLTFSSRREGEVVGEHTVSFSVPGEVLEIRHRALDRDVFASGALIAAKWLAAQPPGFYGSRDWLGTMRPHRPGQG